MLSLYRRWCVAALLACASFPALATSQQMGIPGDPLAVLEFEVPNLPSFVVHGSVPVPPGYYFEPQRSPFTVYTTSNVPLRTQWEPIAYRADGSLMTVELMAFTQRGSMPVGSRQRFVVRFGQSLHPGLDLDGLAGLVREMSLRAVDVHNNQYVGYLDFERIHRYGSVQFTGEWSTRLLPKNPNSSTLEQLGAAQVWISLRRDSAVPEISINFHNGSAQHPSWHLYFKRLELTLPELWTVMPMWPEPQSGETYAANGANVYPLIRQLPNNQVHFLEQRHERGFRLFMHPDFAVYRAQANELKQRKGWAIAVDQIVGAGSGSPRMSWSFLNADTPGYMPQAMTMPSLRHVLGLRSRQITEKNGFFEQISSPVSTGPGETVLFEGAFRNPHGVPYGGMTGGVHMNPFEGMETLYTGEEEALVHAYAIMRCYNDRQPGAMYEDDGLSFRADDAAYLNEDGTQPYLLYNNSFLVTYPGITHDAPWNWHSADQAHEKYAELKGYVPAYRDMLLGWDPIDTQHMWRYSRYIKMLVYLDNDPLARRRMEAACELLRATYYDGPGGRMSDFLTGPSQIGSVFGREHAAAGDFAAAAYACGNGAWRARWKPWFEVYVDALAHIQTPGGVWQANTFGKGATTPPLGDGMVSFFRVLRPNEHVFTQHALRGVKEAVFGEGIDAGRYGTAHDMLVRGGRAVWRLLWMWRLDGSGPAGNGTWDRVAVGDGGPNPFMYRLHDHHPNEQFLDGLALDSYRTGLALAHWFVEEPTITQEMVNALASYSGTLDFLGAATALGVNNIWNNCVLLAQLQNYYDGQEASILQNPMVGPSEPQPLR